MPVVHSSASVFSTEGVLSGHGPSSNVSTTSLSRRKSSCLKCSKPKPGPPVVSISTARPMPSALGLAQAIFAGAGAAAGFAGAAAAAGFAGAAAAAGAGAGAACGAAAAPLGAGACDHAAPDAHNETAPAKIKPAAMRILVPLKPIRARPWLSAFVRAISCPAHNSLVGPAPPRQRLLSTATGLSAEPVNSWPPRGAGVRKPPRNGGFDSGIRGFDGLCKNLRDVAVAADQVLVKVPARDVLRPRLGGPFVERVGVRALDRGFCRDRKGNAMMLRGAADFGGATRLLAAEIIGGNA